MYCPFACSSPQSNELSLTPSIPFHQEQEAGKVGGRRTAQVCINWVTVLIILDMAPGAHLPQLQKVLERLTGQSTIPNVWSQINRSSISFKKILKNIVHTDYFEVR